MVHTCVSWMLEMVMLLIHKRNQKEMLMKKIKLSHILEEEKKTFNALLIRGRERDDEIG